MPSVPFGLEVGETRDHGPHKRALFFGGFVAGNRLHDRNTASAASQQDVTVHLGRVLDPAARIHLQIGEWNAVLGKLGAHVRRYSLARQ